ncbi:MAG: hypothetical protein J6S67_16580 [Methanobrevibacter sp.]|nr:hypothetical protein [Methanobrevibacter sp.]
MASSKIKGIVIEIGGDTSKLQKSLNAVNAPINKINKELNDLNKALKLDPKNTELLAQKQEVLARNIAASKDKLVQLKDAQKQMGDYSKLTDEQKAAYNRLSLEISKSESALKGMNDELRNMNRIDLSKVQSTLKKTGEIAAKVGAAVGGAVLAAAAAVGNIMKKGVESYAQLEKAQKGSERLFGDSFNIVKRNATEAYKTMGLSATQYYDQVNTYVVGLKNSLKGDTKRAAELANSVLIAQADIVAATGANQESVQSAFSAVMRGNYSLLDNLRVGIKGSKQGMQEVIQKVNEWNKAQGHATHYQMDNYADMQQALVDYVKMVGVAGTAQQQMSSTITGSLSQMKAAWDNFINGSGGAKDLSKTMTTFLKNILAAVKRLAPDLAKGLVDLIKDVLPQVLDMIGEILPIIIDAAKTIIEGLINFINNDDSQFIQMAVDILTNLVEFIIKNLPLILQASIKIIVELAKGIANSLPTLIPVMIDALLTMVETLIDNIDLIIDAGIQLIKGLIKGIFIAVPQLVMRLPEIITKIKEKFIEGIGKIVDVGKRLIEGLWEGIKSMGNWLWEKVKGFGESVVDWFADIFGIASPSKVMKEQGKFLGLGLAEGITDTIPEVEKAMSGLASGVDASVNPTINPTANTNPLYITIDKFYNNRGTDIQQLAEELEFYRKNSALAKGGV